MRDLLIKLARFTLERLATQAEEIELAQRFSFGGRVFVIHSIVADLSAKPGSLHILLCEDRPVSLIGGGER